MDDDDRKCARWNSRSVFTHFWSKNETDRSTLFTRFSKNHFSSSLRVTIEYSNQFWKIQCNWWIIADEFNSVLAAATSFLLFMRSHIKSKVFERLSNNNNIINEFCPEKVNRHRHREESAAIAGIGGTVYIFWASRLSNNNNNRANVNLISQSYYRDWEKLPCYIQQWCDIWIFIYIAIGLALSFYLFIYLRSPVIILLISIDRERKRLAFLTKLT